VHAPLFRARAQETRIGWILLPLSLDRDLFDCLLNRAVLESGVWCERISAPHFGHGIGRSKMMVANLLLPARAISWCEAPPRPATEVAVKATRSPYGDRFGPPAGGFAAIRPQSQLPADAADRNMISPLSPT